jgi:hypothetical protein
MFYEGNMASRENAIKNNLNDRARKVGQFDELTTQDIDALIAFYDYSCLQCGERPASSVDHVKPLSKGGTNTRDNLQLLCTNHNKAKGDEEIDYRKGRICPADFVAPTAQNKRNDWNSIENEYITTNVSQRFLSDKYGVSVGDIGNRASAENWTEKREQFQSEVRARMISMIAQARADEHVSAMDLCDSMITQFMQEMARGKAKITAFDAMNAARFREVLRGGVSNRTENVSKDWRDFAKDAGLDEDDVYAEFDRIAAERGRQINDDRGAVSRGEPEELGAGWSD